MNRFVMMWRMAKRGRLIAMIFVSIAILFLASGLSVPANGSQNSGQNNRAIQGSFANCNISVDLDLFNEGIIEYI